MGGIGGARGVWSGSTAGDPPSFEERARAMTLRHVRLAMVVLVVFPVAWMPFDRAFFLERGALPTSFYAVRLSMSGFAAVSFLALRSHLVARGRLQPLVCGVLAVFAGLLGIQFALAGDLARVFFASSYLVPLLTLVLVVRLWVRAVATGAVVLSCLVGFFAAIPELLYDPITRRQIALLGFGAIISVLLGHAVYRILRENHAQRRALHDRARELQALDQLKNDLFANVSHELRTPLTLVLGALRELRTDSTDPSMERAIAMGERNAARLLEQIEDLLDLARFESGRGAPSRRSFDLALLVREVTSNFRPSSPGHGVLEVNGCDEPFPVELDPRQVRTAVYNLLSNAFKFTPPEGRRVEVALEREGPRALLRVRDSGPGIPPAAQESVFDRFYRADPRHARGTGIGLALVREIAEAHGGEVSLESRVGHGSTFHLSLPIGHPSACSPIDEVEDRARTSRANLEMEEELPEEPSAGPDAATIVIAEDDADLRRYLARLLGARYRVVSARDGHEAARRVREECPALLLTDVSMPGMDGHELVRELRADPRLASLPVLFLTARVDTPARRAAYGAGADDFLTKPFDEAELFARLDNLLRLRSSERALAAANETLEERIAERTAQLRQLARHLQRSREDERRKLARELHDETGQLLTALRMGLDQARRKSDAAEIGLLLERMDDVLEQAFDVTRQLVSELRPRVLDDLGLGAAAAWYLEQFGARAELTCRWVVEPSDLVASPETSTAVFRIIQEALTNAARHSGATSVDVRLQMRGETMDLVVRDDGDGFDVDHQSGGFGLLGIRERADAVGAELTIESSPGAGTTVAIRVSDRAQGEAA